MINYIDAHSHFSDDLLKNKNRYISKGICGTICNATVETDWNKISENVVKNDFFAGAIGIHPWMISEIKNGWEDRLGKKLEENKLLMVGEIGLDKNKPDIDSQIICFIKQLQIAHTFNRGAHIHCVGMWDKLLHILKENIRKNPPFIVFHSYTGGAGLIKNLADKYNAFFSYSPHSINNKSEKMIDAIFATPENRLLLESDSDVLTDVIKIADTVCQIKQANQEKLMDSIYKNSILIMNNGQIK